MQSPPTLTLSSHECRESTSDRVGPVPEGTRLNVSVSCWGDTGAGTGGTGLSKKEASSGGPPGGLSGYLSLPEFPYWSIEGSIRMPESGEGVSETQGFREGVQSELQGDLEDSPRNFEQSPTEEQVSRRNLSEQ